MKKPKIFNILVLWTEFFGLLSNSLRGFDKIAFYLSEECFEEELFLNKTSLFYHFRTMSKHFQLLVEIFWAGLSKLHSACPQKDFEEIKNEKTKNFKHSRSLNGNFRTSVEFLPGVCQNCLLLVRRKVLKKNCFWTKHLYFIIFAQWANISNFWLKFFGLFCQNCILGVLNTILRKKIISLKKL